MVFLCKFCNITCKTKSIYDKHILTNKHKKNVVEKNISIPSVNNILNNLNDSNELIKINESLESNESSESNESYKNKYFESLNLLKLKENEINILKKQINHLKKNIPEPEPIIEKRKITDNILPIKFPEYDYDKNEINRIGNSIKDLKMNGKYRYVNEIKTNIDNNKIYVEELKDNFNIFDPFKTNLYENTSDDD